jgi:CheY-like chemotaxis protein
VLAGGIAHDFNNMLTAVLGNISFAKHFADPENTKLLRRLGEAEKASLRARDLTQQLLTFSRGGAPIKETVSLVELLKGTSEFALSGSNVVCEFSILDDLWPVDADQGQISQVIENLIINANQAMPDGGTVHVRAENITVGTRDILPLNKGQYVKVSVTDHGLGIPKDHLSKLFDPYFTTKQEGSGLGLATTYSIIKKHGGYIIADSELGAGTTVNFYLPASEKPVPAKEGEEERLPVGEGKVLVMDDEDSVREVAGDILAQMGYEVAFAKDGAEAIERYKKANETGRPFDAVIMDLTVPGGMGGREALQVLLAIDPEVKAIVSSGYSKDPVMAEFRKHGFKGVVAKPYRIQELGRALHDVLKGTAG